MAKFAICQIKSPGLNEDKKKNNNKKKIHEEIAKNEAQILEENKVDNINAELIYWEPSSAFHQHSAISMIQFLKYIQKRRRKKKMALQHTSDNPDFYKWIKWHIQKEKYS